MERNSNRTSIILGTLLLAAGILTLVGQLVGPAGGYLWPLIITGFGLAFFVGMLVGGRSFGALAIPGTIITGIGLILLLQNLFGMWETWSYTWALVISLVGVGLVIYGIWSGQPDLQRSGWHVARVGLILFIIFGLLFEFIFSVSGFSNNTRDLFWPMVLVVIGLGMIISRTYRLIRYHDEDRRADLNLFWPVIFIGAGILWYMVRLGVLASSDLTVLLSLWPVLLVAAGINLLLGRRFQWINLLLGIAVVVGAFYVIYNDERLGLSARAPWGILGISFSDSQPVNEWISGSGVMAQETRAIGSFTRVALNSSGELILTQGDSPSLTIEAEDNLLPYLISEVKGGQLIIRTSPGVGFTTTRPIRYNLTVTDLQAVDVSGAGSVQSNSLDSRDLRITLSGVGNINLNDLDTESFDVRISGSGSANASGSTGDLSISISGAGSYNGAELKASQAQVSISGLGRAVVWVTDRLETSISGMGGVSYYGSPRLVQRESGIGAVRKLGDK